MRRDDPAVVAYRRRLLRAVARTFRALGYDLPPEEARRERARLADPLHRRAWRWLRWRTRRLLDRVRRAPVERRRYWTSPYLGLLD